MHTKAHLLSWQANLVACRSEMHWVMMCRSCQVPRAICPHRASSMAESQSKAPWLITLEAGQAALLSLRCAFLTLTITYNFSLFLLHLQRVLLTCIGIKCSEGAQWRAFLQLKDLFALYLPWWWIFFACRLKLWADQMDRKVLQSLCVCQMGEKCRSQIMMVATLGRAVVSNR